MTVIPCVTHRLHIPTGKGNMVKTSEEAMALVEFVIGSRTTIEITFYRMSNHELYLYHKAMNSIACEDSKRSFESMLNAKEEVLRNL